MTDAIRDNNHVTVALGVSSTDSTVTTPFKVDPATGRLLTDASGSGYTNLTQFVDQTPWRIFYSNTDGDVVELAFGASGTVLQSNGASAAPTWETVAGSGDVTAASNFGTDNVLIRSDGTAKGVQSTGITVADTSNDISGAGNYGGTGATLSGLTASEILATDASKNLVSLAVATYPSLTELTYVKGVTSAIQTQLNAKQATITFGTGVETALGVNVGSAGSIVVNGGALGTPSSGTLTNATGLPIVAGTTGTLSVARGGTGVTSSTGTGNVVLSASPTFTGTPVLPSSFTIGSNTFTRSGAHTLTLTTSATTNATFPSGTITLVGTAATQTLTNKTLTAPRITSASSINDSNGNELILFPSAVTSAVNEITVSNAATGNAPSIAATGGDTNINLQLTPKGTGIVKGELKRFMVQLLADDANNATGTSIGGDFRISNRAITVKAVGAYVDTAGTTGTQTIDINEAGTTILSTKITIDSTEKSSETAATPPVISDSAIAADAIVTIDVDAVQTTPAQGLKVWIDYVYA